jgi:hypothetical protein
VSHVSCSTSSRSSSSSGGALASLTIPVMSR